MDERKTQPLGGLSHRFREARGRLSPERAAAALKLSPAVLGAIEAGERDVTVGQMLAAAQCYGVELRSLMFGRPPVDPTLAALGPELAELMQEYLRDRYGAERVDQLNDAELAEFEQAVAQARHFGGLVDGMVRRGGEQRDLRSSGAELAALTDAFQRINSLVERHGTGAHAVSAPGAVPGFSFEALPAEALQGHHSVFREALDWYGRTAGRVADDEMGFERILPWLQILVPTSEGFPYLYCGDLTPPAEFWGKTVARSLVGRFSLPDDALDRATAQAFPVVHGGSGPLIQAVRGPVVVSGTSRFEAWHRFVMPLEFRGLSCVAALAVLDRKLRRRLD